jgi:flagellin
MSIVVNTNIGSLNAQRSLAESSRDLATAMERLSSGKKINSAADDAAGFAIAERMTAQIRGLNMATKNANDGLAMLSTIENATNDVTDMLQRVRELAVQASNDTNSTTDRQYLQKEVDSLLNEINRVSSQTVYNDKTVLNGNLSGQLQVGTDNGQNIAFAIKAIDTDTLGLTGSTAVAAKSTFAAADAHTDDKVTVLTMDGAAMSFTNDASSTIDELVAGLKAHANFDAAKHQIEKDGVNLKATMLVGGVKTITLTNDAAAKTATAGAGTVAGVAAGATSGAFTAGTPPSQIATTSSDNIGTLTAGTDGVLGLSVLTASDAEAALTRISVAIEQVAGNRAEYGAMSNRLEYTVSNLMNVAEFTTSARSRIEDADFAAESARLAKAQVLQQTGTAMLAQANAASQLAVQLIR